MTRMTMAALPMVEEMDGESIKLSATQVSGKRREEELTHCDDIASYCVAEGEIASNSNKYIQECCSTYAGKDYSGGSEMRINANLVQY